jgi:hypothetical protein
MTTAATFVCRRFCFARCATASTAATASAAAFVGFRFGFAARATTATATAGLLVRMAVSEFCRCSWAHIDDLDRKVESLSG